MKKEDRLASKLAAQHETRDPYQLCRALGVRVHRHPLVGIRGYYVEIEQIPIVTLASDLPEWPARFVCAHELGHSLLHRGLNRPFMDSRTFMLPDKYETEADRFACQLLFSLPPLYAEQALSNWQMAECLNVPACTVDARLIELGIYH